MASKTPSAHKCLILLQQKIAWTQQANARQANI